MTANTPRPPSYRLQHSFRRRVRPRSDDPRLRPGLGTLSELLDTLPGQLQQRKATMPATTTYGCGVNLLHDKQHCYYRIGVEPGMPDAEFKSFFAEHLKPLLIERYELDGGQEVRFHYQPASSDWCMRYLHVACDAEGREIVEEGKPKQVSSHRQVQAIAEQVADAAAAMLAEQYP